MTSTRHEHFLASRDEASLAAAAFIAAALTETLDAAGEASLVVTGGSSPARCYAALAETALDWDRVHIALSDERWVSANDDASNEKLVRDKLITDKAKHAKLLPMFAADATLAEQCQTLNDALPALPSPFACVLLGMGADGHFASLFPDAINLAAGLDTDSPDWCMPIKTAASEHMRISLTLAALLHSKVVVLLIFGDDKRDVYAQATRAADFPVTRLLTQTCVPVHVFWAP